MDDHRSAEGQGTPRASCSGLRRIEGPGSSFSSLQSLLHSVPPGLQDSLSQVWGPLTHNSLQTLAHHLCPGGGGGSTALGSDQGHFLGLNLPNCKMKGAGLDDRKAPFRANTVTFQNTPWPELLPPEETEKVTSPSLLLDNFFPREVAFGWKCSKLKVWLSTK